MYFSLLSTRWSYQQAISRGDLHMAPSTNWFNPGAAWKIKETHEQSWLL